MKNSHGHGMTTLGKIEVKETEVMAFLNVAMCFAFTAEEINESVSLNTTETFLDHMVEDGLIEKMDDRFLAIMP